MVYAHTYVYIIQQLIIIYPNKKVYLKSKMVEHQSVARYKHIHKAVKKISTNEFDGCI